LNFNQAAFEALALTPLRSATVLSLVLAALFVQISIEEARDLVVTKFLF
jgi:hypothetical protein